MVVQDRELVRIHRVPGELSDVRWPPGVNDRVDLPPDCSAGDLAEVLEFLKVSHKSHWRAQQRPIGISPLAFFKSNMPESHSDAHALGQIHLLRSHLLHYVVLCLRIGAVCLPDRQYQPPHPALFSFNGRMRLTKTQKIYRIGVELCRPVGNLPMHIGYYCSAHAHLISS